MERCPFQSIRFCFKVLQAQEYVVRKISWDSFRRGNPRRKRPIWRLIGNVRFAETGWWAHQRSNLGPADRFAPQAGLLCIGERRITRPPWRTIARKRSGISQALRARRGHSTTDKPSIIQSRLTPFYAFPYPSRTPFV